MIVDVFNEIYTKFRTEISDVNIETEFPDETPDFPCIVLEETINTCDLNSKDSSGETHNIQGYTVNIFDNSSTKRTVVRALVKQVDAIMSDEYGMNRGLSDPVPNYADLSVYRYILRYDFKINDNKTIYGG